MSAGGQLWSELMAFLYAEVQRRLSACSQSICNTAKVNVRTTNQLPVKRHMVGKRATCVHFFTFPILANVLCAP